MYGLYYNIVLAVFMWNVVYPLKCMLFSFLTESMFFFCCRTTDTNVIMRRHKSIIEDDDRPVRRVSYLRATANENSLQLLDSDMDASPAPPYTPDADAPPITQILKR